MSSRLEFTKGITGQKIWFYPEHDGVLGRPSATPTVAIYGKDFSGNVDRAAANTYVTQDTVNTTTSAAASKGDKTLTLTAVTGLEFRKHYLVTNADGQKERVRNMGANTSTKVMTLDKPLEFDHASGATVQGCGFYYTLQSGDVDELGEGFRARAAYTVDSQQYYQDVAFDVVLLPLINPLTVEFLKKRRANVFGHEPSGTRGTDFLDLREAAWDEVRKAIRGVGRYPDQWRPALVKTPDDLERWGLAELDLMLWQNGVDVLTGDWDAQQATEHLESRVRVERERALATLEWVDVDDNDTRDEDEHRPSMGPDFVR